MRLFKGIKTNVVVLGITSFFTDISSEMLYPIIPIFLTSVLGAPMSIVGLIEGVAESAASILKAVSGWLSDRTGKRRPLVIAGYSLSSFSKPILYLAFAWPVVLLSRFLDRIGKGLRTSARDAMIVDATEASFRGKAFGFHRAMDTLGACIGPLLAIFFLTAMKENLRTVFLIAFVPAAVAVLALLFFLKESHVAKRVGHRLKITDFKAMSPQLKRFLFASSRFALGNSSDAFLIVRSKGLGLSTTLVVLAYVLYNITYSVFSTPFGALSDRIGRRNIMVIGYAIFAAVYVGFSMASSSALVWILFPVYGLYIAMTDGVGKAMAADMSTEGSRGTILGIYHFLLGIFAFLASVIAGLLWTHVGIHAPFIYGAVTSAASCALLIFLIR
jgi:MFS family permease